jgi:hypothetical protein
MSNRKTRDSTSSPFHSRRAQAGFSALTLLESSFCCHDSFAPDAWKAAMEACVESCKACMALPRSAGCSPPPPPPPRILDLLPFSHGSLPPEAEALWRHARKVHASR